MPKSKKIKRADPANKIKENTLLNGKQQKDAKAFLEKIRNFNLLKEDLEVIFLDKAFGVAAEILEGIKAEQMIHHWAWDKQTESLPSETPKSKKKTKKKNKRISKKAKK